MRARERPDCGVGIERIRDAELFKPHASHAVEGALDEGVDVGNAYERLGQSSMRDATRTATPCNGSRWTSVASIERAVPIKADSEPGTEPFIR